MLRTLAIHGYRSLRDLALPLGRLTLITGANGSGKSSIYRALRLLADAAQNSVVASLSREGGIQSTLWAGPERIARSVRQNVHAVEATVRKDSVSLRLGFGSDLYGYSIDMGYPPPGPPATMFVLDPRVKRECLWHGPVYRRAAALVERRNSYVWLATGQADQEPLMLTQHLADTDSMLAAVADPGWAPEMLALREAVRGWRFYDHMRTDTDAPARATQIGTFSPVLHHDGGNLAATLQTIIETRADERLQEAVEDAFPGTRLYVEDRGGFQVRLQQHGLLRPLSAAELSDGTLRYLLLCAALLSPRPPELLVLNEPETSLHPELLPALGRLILAATDHTQIIVVSHSSALIAELEKADACMRLHLVKDFGETTVEGRTLFNAPKWVWPAR